MQRHIAVLGIVILSLTVGCSGTSVEQQTAVAAAPSAAQAAEGSVESTGAELDPVVCKREIQTGTRIARRVCMRQSQWDIAQDAGSKMATDVQRRTVQTGNTVQPD